MNKTTYINEKPGTRYGNWEVIRFHKVDSHKDARFFCECKLCGETYSIKGYTLRNGTSTKCTKCARKRKVRRYGDRVI